MVIITRTVLAKKKTSTKLNENFIKKNFKKKTCIQ